MFILNKQKGWKFPLRAIKYVAFSYSIIFGTSKIYVSLSLLVYNVFLHFQSYYPLGQGLSTSMKEKILKKMVFSPQNIHVILIGIE
jgi:hypothetical protein